MSDLHGTWVLDPAHTNIGFVARHAMVTKVRGGFHEYESSITYGETPSATVTLKVDSFDTGITDRDNHIKSADFFDVENYPEITFTATEFNLDETGNGTVVGDLTIKGVTKPVTLDVETEGVAEDPYGNTRLGFEATTKIKRSDWGINYNTKLKTGGVLISDDIRIEIEGSAIKQ